MSEVLIEVQNLKKTFPLEKLKFFGMRPVVHAVNGLNFKINRGETLGIVGESGSGKSTLGKLLLNLIKPSNGKVLFNGKHLENLSSKEMRNLRKKIQMIFQDPYASLNPRMKTSDIIGEGLDIHQMARSSSERSELIFKALDACGAPRGWLEKYPHQFSGGQRQRICIARALAVEPEFIVCDEPVSALDVSVQAQIINLLMDLQTERNLTYVFISHDLSVVQQIADRVAVMYLGQIVEIGAMWDIFKKPKHPYTRTLIDSIPIVDPKDRLKKRALISGEISTNTQGLQGCVYAQRCRWVKDRCLKESPELIHSSEGRMTACHYIDEVNSG